MSPGPDFHRFELHLRNCGPDIDGITYLVIYLDNNFKDYYW